MTNTDFIREFDLLYNNALGASAPNLNSYEKSLFMTQAQENIIRDLYQPKNGIASFELNERIRRRLKPLVIAGKSTFDSAFDLTLTDLKINSNSKFFIVSDNIWYITYEAVMTDEPKQLKVIPTSLDKVTTFEDNPFKQPNKRKAWRLDVANTTSSENVVEIISTKTLASYNYRYLTKPTPIVLVDLDTDPVVGGNGLSIDGVTGVTESVLPSEAHRLILKSSVELATVAYKENTLSNNVQIDNK